MIRRRGRFHRFRDRRRAGAGPAACWLLAAALLLGARPAAAQPGGGRFTLPLPAGELPDGTLTVKVVGSDMRDIQVDQPVRLLQDGSQQPLQTQPTGADGRARFSGLEPGARYLVQVQPAGQEQPLTSAPFSGPQTGGVRLLLTLGGGGGRPGAAASGSMPAGHPQTGQPGGMPGGHPPVDGAGQQDRQLPGGHPPVAGAGQQDGSGAARIAPSADVTPGQVQVLVARGRAGAPLEGATVTVVTPEQIRKLGGRLNQALALGQRHDTDEQGRAVLDLDAKLRQVLLVAHDGMTYRSGELDPPFSAGLRASFQVFDRTTRSDKLELGEGTHLMSQVGEGALSFMQVINLVNSGDKLYDPGEQGLALPLPRGATGVEIGDEYRDVMELVPPRGAGPAEIRFTAPVPPGGFSIRYFYTLPYDRPELAFQMRVPLKTARVMLAFINGQGLQLEGPDVAGRERRALSSGHEGLAEVFYLRPVAAGGSLAATISGLPHRDQRQTWGVLALSALLLLWGVGAALVAPRWRQRRQLRRERLLDELASLERRSGADKDDPRRREILRDLRGVWDGS
jgi:hypothetical protein